MDADRNLLFGVLALQADLLDSDRFARACALWAANKSRPLADVLVEQGWLTPADRADVSRLLDRKLAKHGGDVKASLAEATTHQVRRSVAGVADPALTNTLAGLTPPPDGHVLVATTDYTPESRDRYTLSRLHATGGIGRVWLARDAGLGRDVALKELRPERAGNPAVWARFLKEAKITGQLEHPGIVPVYAVGHRPEDQAPFYTMRFVRGRTLAEAAVAYHTRRQSGAAGPLELRELLTAVVGVCHAVAYAHSRGVIHRDLKPQNVVLGDFGEVIVLDWGLAKLVGEADDAHPPMDLAAADQTAAGQVVGTPAYMAPEQAEGRLDRLDARTDVYGLGAILYEVLAGRPPFTGADTATVLRRVVNDPPDRPRAVVPKTPAALEAVCLKALAKAPADRYASAKDLAAEVQRWLADEPVGAYRERLPVRVGRWARRRRTLVAGAAGLLVAVAVASTLGVVLIGRKNVEIAARRADAEDQRRLAQANFRKARAAVDKMLTRVGSERLRDVPMMEKLRRELLEEAAAFHTDFLREQSADPEVRHEAGLAYARLGQIYHRLRQDAEADRAGAEAVARLQGLADEFPDRPAYRRDLAAAHAQRAGLPLPPADAETAGRAALALRRALVAEDPGSADYRADLGHDLLLLVALTRSAARYAEAERAVREAEDIFRRLVEEAPARPEYQDGLAQARHRLGIVLEATGRLPDAEGPITEGVAILEKRAAAAPDSADAREALAASRRGLGVYYARRGRPDDAEKLFLASVGDFEWLAAEFPFSPDYQGRVATGYNDLGVLRARAGRFADAEPYFLKAADRHAKLAADFPRVPDYRRTLGFSRLTVAQLQLDTRRPREAAETLRQVLATRQKLADEFPAVPDYRWDLSVAHSVQGRVLYQLGEAKSAEEQHRAALRLGAAVVAERGNLPDYRHKLALARRTFGDFLRAENRPGEAEGEYRRAAADWEKLTAEVPRADDYRRQLATALAALGDLRLAAGKPGEADDLLARAVQVGEKLAADSPGRVELRENCVRLAAARVRAGRYTDAEAAARRGVEVGGKLAGEQPGNPDHRAGLARAYKTLAAGQLGAGRRAEAVGSLRAAREQSAKLPPGRANDLYLLAAVHALESTAAGEGASAEAAAAQAVAALRRAVAAGYRDAAHLRADPDLAPLRGRADFQKLLADLDAKPAGK